MAGSALNTEQVMAALAARHSPPAWAFLPEVRSGTGYLRAVRTADAFAMSLWPSRGLELHGFEVKVSRGDWLRELKDPAKAEDLFAFCDRWWLVVGARDIVKPGELPPTWGLMVPRGEQLIVETEAPKLESQPPDKLLLASILRDVLESWVPKSSILAKLKKEYERGEESGKRAAERDADDYERLKEAVAKFEKESGVSIKRDWYAGNIGRAVRDVMHHGPEYMRHQIKTHAGWLRRMAEECDRHLADESVAK